MSENERPSGPVFTGAEGIGFSWYFGDALAGELSAKRQKATISSRRTTLAGSIRRIRNEEFETFFLFFALYVRRLRRSAPEMAKSKKIGWRVQKC